ncbi:MAG: UbiA family prenyltransferase [Ignavibacteriales bacterium]|nr:UbiA family prenyltransferase [Ignavibacteriales bacterium]
MLEISEPGFVRRMRIYLAEMFPLPIRFASSLLMYGSFAAILRRMQGWPDATVSFHTLAGILSVFLVLLMLRLMDELKDKVVDYRLFRDRPLPSGKVLERDIRLSLWLVTGLFLMLNMAIGRAFWMAVIVILYAYLMFKFFFVPQLLKRNLLLTLATHNPIIPLLLLFLVALLADENKRGLSDLHWLPILLLIAQYWSMSFAWEIARKIRAAEEENEYVTYSRIFGRWGAVGTAAAAQTIALGLGLSFCVSLSLSVFYVLILCAGYVIVAAAYVRFLVSPNSRTSKLRPFAEMFLLSAMAAGFVEQFVRFHP